MNNWFDFLIFMAEKAPKNKQPESPLTAMLVPFLIIGFLWYFLILRPQQKQRQKRETLLDGLKMNQKVVTIGGIIGTITNLTDDQVTIRIDDTVKMKMLRDSIRGPLKEPGTAEAEQSDD